VTLFSELELKYLKTQYLARVATVSGSGQPEVSPVGFEYDGKYFYVGSYKQDIFFKTWRYKNITAGNAKVSLVVDDLESVDPWKVRGIKVKGTAEVVKHNGEFGEGSYLRITPSTSISWGIEPVKEGEWGSRTLHQ
jgi:pyridoxamine 5'-phosphate oxidase family protein